MSSSGRTLQVFRVVIGSEYLGLHLGLSRGCLQIRDLENRIAGLSRCLCKAGNLGDEGFLPRTHGDALDRWKQPPCWNPSGSWLRSNGMLLENNGKLRVKRPSRGARGVS